MKGTIEAGKSFFIKNKWTPFPFQEETWQAYLKGKHGLVNAPTGSGKTYSLLIPILLEFIKNTQASEKSSQGLQAIWITPIRALSKEIELSANRLIEFYDLSWRVGIRSGDTSTKEREQQKKNPPQLLITTPESLHLLLAQKGYASFFKNLKAIVADEWHELMGSKRGVQVELALSRLKCVASEVKVWGISATIGNMNQAIEILHGVGYNKSNVVVVKAAIEKQIEIISVFPDAIESLPWSGHVGLHLMEKVVEIVKNSGSTLIFTNTRSFAEIWYRMLLEKAPEYSGLIAMHHSAISQELRSWVEDQLHLGNLKAVICTSSLDLGVDFRPVETIIQVGSPKGIARFMQRAGRSGHQPGAISKIHLVPTHALELMEAAALREAIDNKIVEERIPYLRSFDVLLQYLVTLAVSEGFNQEELYKEVIQTVSFSSLSKDEWIWLLRFITEGGDSLEAYDQFRKVIIENGVYKVESRMIAMRHRLSIGTIVGDSSLFVKYVNGKNIGTIEEYFISRLTPGDVFWFAGRSLELIRIKEMEVHVRNSKRKSGLVPSWQGGRMPLSSQLSKVLRNKIDEVACQKEHDVELKFLKPMFDLQRELSIIPSKKEFLIEYLETEEGYHVLMYPFEGRFVHEGLAALVAYRISKLEPITFSIAMNDYGFELLADLPIPIEEAVETNLLGIENLGPDIQASINATEMARRKFRDIAAISGLVFKGFPGKPIKDRHLQSTSQLFFDVFNDYEAHNLLLIQAFEEVMDFQLEEARMRLALERIKNQKIIIKKITKPTPFGFPIMVDRLREKLTSETLAERLKRMQLDYR